jgi:putative lipoic acid-binding regulatory protein
MISGGEELNLFLKYNYMSDIQTPDNGNTPDTNDAFSGAKLEFPVTFQLKTVLDTSLSSEEQITNIGNILNDLNIANKYLSNKASSKGSYTSYQFEVTIISKPQMETMYDNIKKLPDFKFAL